eukprot:CAMPEP_0183833262 /NCGR_PEP_ID=MMETSP0807_2-20130328/5954_1 /TAXON_ID=88271 /ORGANISM="Picocystis salinarum, Strain CCMP1897" /LENGTH=32 /DNA_ID= /DNA_START= /DNA_END= /DNA_ORIENTATION=
MEKIVVKLLAANPSSQCLLVNNPDGIPNNPAA